MNFQQREEITAVQELKEQNQAASTFIVCVHGCAVEREKVSRGKRRGRRSKRSERVLAWHNESYLLASDSVRDRDRVQTLDTSCSAS